MATRTEAPIDGRRARRERGRLAVTEAMIDLVLEGNIPPTSEQVADRAGVSAASLFRYFDTLDDLRRATTRVYFDRYAGLFEIPDVGHGMLDGRIDRFVSSRMVLYETIEPMARLARWRAAGISEVDETLHQVRATRADQIRRHFEPELDRLTPAVADDTSMVVATLTSFESWDQARQDHRRSPAQVRRAWTMALHKVLEP